MERKISEPQKRLFFALCNNLEIDPEKAKNKAKKKYGVEHFKDLTVEQAAELIDALELRMEAVMIKCPNCRGTGYIKKETLEGQGEIEA